MKVIVFLGPPGVGKGTQASLLSTRLGFEHLSTGMILRSEIASNSELGNSVKAVVESGSLVSDDILFQCLRGALVRTATSGKSHLLLDGVPRRVSQIEKLDTLLASQSLKVDLVAALTAPVQQLTQRFSMRWNCGKCGNVDSFPSEQIAQSGVCKKCGTVGEFFRREDDSPESVHRRFDVYQAETEPLLRIYRQRGIDIEINGLRQAERVYVDLACGIVRV